MSAEEFVNQKIAIKIKPSTSIEPYVFGKFKYITDDENDRKDREIFLVCSPRDKATTNLYFVSHIPSANKVIILEENKKKVIKTKQYLRVQGDVYAFCIDITNYYLEEINLDEYIEYVQLHTHFLDVTLYGMMQLMFIGNIDCINR